MTTLNEQPWRPHFPFDQARPYQVQVINRILDAFRERKRRFVIVEAPTGCHARGTAILMHGGSRKPVEEIVVGDTLVGPDSKPRHVLGLHRGRDAMARIVPAQGEPFVVNAGHVLSLQRTTGAVVNVSVRQYLDGNFKETVLYRTPVAHFPPQDAPDVLQTAFHVETLPPDDYFGFEVDQDHLYLMGDFTVTHNSGKSPIGITVARAMGTSYYAVPQRFLQDQIERDFGDSVQMLKGKSNYPCNVYEGTNCATAPCNRPKLKWQIRECRDQGTCQYYDTRDKAMSAKLTVLNFANLLTYMALEPKGPWFEPRDLLVIDECHGLGDSLDQYATIELTPATLRCVSPSLPDLHAIQGLRTYPEVRQFVADRLLPQIDTMAKGLYEAVDPTDLTLGTATTLNEDLKNIKDLEMKCRTFLALGQGEYVISPIMDGSYRIGTKVQPLTVAHVKDLAFKAGRQILLMSATILDPDAFCESLGIDHQEVEFVSVPNTFPVEHGVFLYDPVGLMSNRNIKETLPAMIARLRLLLADHRDQKGIIHTANYEVTRYIEENLRDPRLLFQLTADDKFTILAHHTESPEPTVLVGPGLTEGLDLKGPLGEWGVVVKIPFLNLTDPVVAARKERNPRWYNWKTAISITQARGRLFRSAEDRAIFYMLDQCWDNVLRYNRNMYPGYVLEQYQRRGG